MSARAAGLALLLAAACSAPPPAYERAPLAWSRDAVWHDGLAEKCVYEATRTVYGEVRRYRARAYTNKEHVDPATGAKSESGAGVEVFKHHWSEIVPTERYDYRFSTMSYTRAADLAPYKLTVSTQDDCGASFKEAWREGAGLAWSESVYFPGGGRRAGRIEPVRGLVLGDALTLVLRDYDFAAPSDVDLTVLARQLDVQRVPFELHRRRVRYAGRSTLDLPIGAIDAHALEVLDGADRAVEKLWFAAEGAAPWCHALVAYEGPNGTSFRLVSHERTAYWERG